MPTSSVWIVGIALLRILVVVADPWSRSHGRSLVTSGIQVTVAEYSSDYPGVVALYSGANRANGKPQQHCAGVFIAGDAILTAAHCLFEEDNGAAFMDGNTKEVILGVDSSGARYEVVDAVRATGTDPHGRDLGIAILGVCIPAAPVFKLPCCDRSIKGEAATLLGWGEDWSNPLDPVPSRETLRKGAVSLLPVCPDSEVQSGMTEAQIVCVVDGMTGSVGPAPGDSGGSYIVGDEVLAIQSSGNALVAVAMDLGYWRPWILSALKSSSKCQGYEFQAGQCTGAQAAECSSGDLDCTRSNYGASQVPITNCGSDGMVDTDTKATTTTTTVTTAIPLTTTTTTSTTTSTTSTPFLSIVTVKGRGSGEFTFYTSFSSKPCSDLTLEDLPHMDLMVLSTVIGLLVAQFGVNAQCIAVFGVLIVNTLLDIGLFNSHDWSLFIANALAAFLDRDMDGLADPGQPMYYLRSGHLLGDDTMKGAWIPVLDSNSLSKANPIFEMLGGGQPIGYTQFSGGMTVEQSKASVLEELIHTWHQFGLARMYPDYFGVTSVPDCETPTPCIPRYGGTDYYCHTNTGCTYMSSLVTRCFKASSCIWYTKKLECSASGSSCVVSSCLTGGTCADPACAGTEWFYDLMMAWSGQGDDMGDNPGTINGGLRFPKNRTEAESKLKEASSCEDLLEIIQDPWYQMLEEPLLYHYTTIPQGTATTTTTSTTQSRTTVTTTTATTTTTREWPQEPMNRERRIRTLTVDGMGGGSLEVTTVWQTKACNLLEHWELPHLEEEEVVMIRNKIFQKYGAYSLCVSVFGILVICNIQDVGLYKNEPWCLLEANIVGELIDPDVDGYPDNIGIWENMRSKPGGHYLFLRSSTILNSVQDEMSEYIGTTIEVRQERDFSSTSFAEDSKRAMVEETFHVYHRALAKTYPDIYGVPNTDCLDTSNYPNESDSSLTDFPPCPYGPSVEGCNWQSTLLTRCAWWGMCNFYTEALCCAETGKWASADYISGGHCSNPSCAATEFFFHLFMAWSGTGSGYSYNVGEVLPDAEAFPTDKQQVETMFRKRGGDCFDLLNIMANRSFYMTPRTLTLYYAPYALERTSTTTTRTTTTTTSTTCTTISKTTSTITTTTSTSTTSTLPSSLVTYIRGSFDLSVDSPMTFIYDSFVLRACTRAIAELAQCPEDWINLELSKAYSRWLQQLNYSSFRQSLSWLEQLKMSGSWRGSNDTDAEAQRRLVGFNYVKAEYGIGVPPGMNPYAISQALSTPSIDNVTETMRRHVISTIGTSANLQVLVRSAQTLDVMNYSEYLTWKPNWMDNQVSGNPDWRFDEPTGNNGEEEPGTERNNGTEPTKAQTDGTVAQSTAVLSLMLISMRSLTFLFYDC